MRKTILIFVASISMFSAICQDMIWQQNKASVDSLILGFRSRCPLLVSNLKHAKRKTTLDLKLFKFLNDFYSGKLNEDAINGTLKISFKQSPWRFDEITRRDSMTRYQGRIRSFGNIEAFVGYVVLRGKIIGRRVYFRVRSRVDCLQQYDQEIDDLIYLSNLIPNQVLYPIDFSE